MSRARGLVVEADGHLVVGIARNDYFLGTHVSNFEWTGVAFGNGYRAVVVAEHLKIWVELV